MADEAKSSTGPRKAVVYQVKEKGGKIERNEIELPALAPGEVEVQITHSGICFSDIDALAGHYPEQMYPFPMVGGHEGVGIVSAVGSHVKARKVGDRVGCGVYRAACMSCIKCANGAHNLCAKKWLMFSMGKTGTFAQYVRLDAEFAIPLPDEVPLDSAGPLLCAGVTVFAPFVNQGIKPGHSVAVLGIGGLGHLALQFGKAYGCKMTALSRGKEKEEACKKLGAHVYIDTKDEEEQKKCLGQFDFILCTASSPKLDYKWLINSLTSGGKLILIGNPGFADISISPIALLMGQKAVIGSASGSLGNAVEMLRFAAIHGVKPVVEKFKFDDINEAIERVRKNDVTFRAVVCMDPNEVKK